MKKINNFLLIGFFLVAVFLLSKIISPFGGDNLEDTQTAATYPSIPSATPVNPTNFWEFSGTTTTAQKTPTIGSAQFAGSNNPNWTVGTSGQVGNYIDRTSLSAGITNIGTLSTGSNGAFTVEFMWKPGRYFWYDTILSGQNFSLIYKAPAPEDNPGQFNGVGPFWSVNLGSTEYKIYLNGTDRKSTAYYTDGNWHHIALVYDPSSSSKKFQMWVDGQLPSGFYFNPSSFSAAGSLNIGVNSSSYTATCSCLFDQLALYNKAIPGNLVVEHYNNMLAGQTYQFWTNVINTVEDNDLNGVFNPFDFMAGTDLSTSTTPTPGVTTTVLNQIKSYPLPRYKPNNTLIRNVPNWLVPRQLANHMASVIPGVTLGENSANVAKYGDIIKEFSDKWRYMLSLGDASAPCSASANTTSFQGMSYTIANQSAYHNTPTSLSTYRIQSTSVKKVHSVNNPDQYYLRNGTGSTGSLIERINGSVVSAKAPYNIRPLLSQISYYDSDGTYMKGCVQNIINAMPQRKAAVGSKTIGLINDNAEDLPYAPPYTIQALNNDPDVSAAISASGLGWQKYVGRFAGQIRERYKDTILSADGAQSAIFQHYLTDGIDGTLGGAGFGYDWTEYKIANSLVNGMRYSTSDFYTNTPDNWIYWSSYRHGDYYARTTRLREIMDGDYLFSPYTSAGWSNDEKSNIRPAQYLAFLKYLSVFGAEYFYPGLFFDTQLGPLPGPENVVWQSATAPYAQAVTSYFEEFLKTGKIMRGDVPRCLYPCSSDQTQPGFRFYSGDPAKLILARKLDNANKFVITGSLMPWSNKMGNVPEEQNADILFGGNTFPSSVNTPIENLKFKIRRQGSTYIYDKTGTSPVFYQLDSWHESKHPWYWSKDFSFEAEVYDTGSASRTTTVPAGTPAGDYTNFTTYINPSSGSTTYNFEPRDSSSNSSKTFYIWALVKSSSGTSSGQFKIDSGTNQSISTSSGSFVWCKATSSVSGVVSNIQHTLTFTGSSSNFQLDKILLTTDANLNLGNCGGSGVDTIPPTVSITAPTNGATITSGPVTISANASDASGIASVEFKVDGNSIGIDNSAPYSISWNLTGVSNGSHQIVATATDNASNTTNASISVTVNLPDTIAPTAPSNLSVSRSNNSAVLSWSSSTDTGGSGLAGYYVYRDGSSTALNSTPVSATTYTDTPSANTNHTYTVKAADNAGNLSGNSNQVSILIDTLGPTVNITSPSSGSTVSGTINVSATLTDSTGVNHFDAYIGNTIVCSASAGGQTSVTLSCQWNTTQISNGNYSFSIKAYDTVTNPGSNSTTTTAFQVTVNNQVTPPPDTTLPTVSMTAPANGSTVTGNINVSATANDNVGISKVEFYLDNSSTPFATVTVPTSGSTYSTSFNTTTISNGTHTFKAKAFDISNNTATSSTVSVTVNNTSAGVPDLVVLSISPTSAVVGQNVTFSAQVKNQGTGPVNASSSIPVGISWYVNGVSVGCSDARVTPIAAGETVTIEMGTGTSWCTTSPLTPFWNAVVGTHNLYAIVDDVGRFTESNETNNQFNTTLIVSSDTTAPSTSISSPASGSVITAGTNVSITALASDASGIANVKIYVNGNQIGSTLTASPYSVSWNTAGLSSGSYSITSIATDNAGNSATSSPVSVTISTSVADTTPPTVTFSCPNSNCNVSNTSPVTFSAVATDNVGVTEVKFFLGSTSTTPKCTLTQPTASPNTYSCNITIGTAFTWFKKTINVQVRDAAGNVTTKSIQVY